jgi:hypothetical protein
MAGSSVSTITVQVWETDAKAERKRRSVVYDRITSVVEGGSGCRILLDDGTYVDTPEHRGALVEALDMVLRLRVAAGMWKGPPHV